MDLFTGFFGGFVIFSVIGHVSYRTGIPIEKFNQSGKCNYILMEVRNAQTLYCTDISKHLKYRIHVVVVTFSDSKQFVSELLPYLTWLYLEFNSFLCSFELHFSSFRLWTRICDVPRGGQLSSSSTAMVCALLLHVYISGN